MTAEQIETLKQMSWIDFFKKYMPMRLSKQINDGQFQKLIEIKQDNPKQIAPIVPFNEKAEKDVVEEVREMF